MPVTVSYPGVYIEEIPSGVHTITGVATSIAAFIGWAPQGPVGNAQLVLSWPDFSRQFGGLDSRSYLGYAVYHFFSNGGQQAYIVRLVANSQIPAQQPPLTLAATASTPLVATGGGLTITAENPGDWANSYGVLVKNQILNGNATGRFRLQIAYAPAGNPPPLPVVVESFENLSFTSPDPQGRNVVDIITAQSNFVTASVTSNPTAFPQDITTPQMLKGGAPGSSLKPSTNAGTPGAFESALIPNPPTGGIFLLDHVDLFNLLCVPGEIVATTLSTLEQYCEGLITPGRRAFLIADSDPGISDYTKLLAGPPFSGKNAAFYFPWLSAPDPLNQGGTGPFPPCGFVAGVYASTDTSRGVWKAPAGTATQLVGVIGPTVPLNDAENGQLNPVAVNCIRDFPVYNTVVWGARTTLGNDEIGSEWKYIPVRRMALFIEESLFRALKWVVFEPNDEPLWSQIRLNVGAFMQNLFRQGAFQGQTPQDAYFVKCDKESTTQNDINLGIVNIVVGFAPLKPAEFVVIQIQQMAGQIAT